MNRKPIAKRPIHTKPMSESANFSKKVRRMLGLSLHGWENVMIAMLVFAGAFALLAGISTWVVIKLQREEIAEAKIEADRYKSETGKNIAQANARGEEAKAVAATAQKDMEVLRAENLALQQFIAPRSIPPETQRILGQFFAPLKGRNILISSYSMDTEAAFLSDQIAGVLTEAGAEVENKTSNLVVFGSFALGIHITGSDEQAKQMIASGLSQIGGLLVVADERAQKGHPGERKEPAAVAILVGSKPRQVRK
jgi:hypothetical protein